MDYRIISGDGHMDIFFMPEDVFTANASSKWKDQVPHVIETDRGLRWEAGGTDRGSVGSWKEFLENPTSEHKRKIETFEKAGLYEITDGRYPPANADVRIQHLERDGVDAEVIYGLLDVPQPDDDPELKVEIYRIYNDWIADFTKGKSDRLAGLACLPNHDPKVAAAELLRVAKLGLRGAEISPGTMSKPMYHKDWDPLWAAGEETGLPISFHTLELWPRKIEDPVEAEAYGDIYSNILLTMFQLSGVEYLSSIVFSGACERYPNFKFVLGECGVSWLPYVLDRMDYEGEGQEGLSLKPSGYFRRQGFSTFESEPTAGDIIPLAGEDRVMWGSDYPHVDGSWPNSQKAIDRDMKKLSDTARRKVTRDNAGKLYGFL
jgi:predicted TIM-barrel fold metal-dependent hydrolase